MHSTVAAPPEISQANAGLNAPAQTGFGCVNVPALYQLRIERATSVASQYSSDQPESAAWMISDGPTGQAMIPVTASPIHLDLGRVPLTVEPFARRPLSRLPWHALAAVLAEIRAWMQQAPVVAVRAVAVTDPESPGWTEAVLVVRLRTDGETALRLWDSLASAIDGAKVGLDHDDRVLLDRHLGVHLAWEDDDTGTV